MKLELEIEGLNETLALFDGVESFMIDFRQLGTWKAVGSEFRKIEAEAFSSEGGSSKGGKWKALSSPYKAQKLKRWGPVPILTASGKLYRSMTQEGAEGSVYEETAQELTIGSSVPYGRYHQSGTSRMPARPPIDLTDEQKQKVVSPVGEKLKQLIANAKLKNLRGF